MLVHQFIINSKSCKCDVSLVSGLLDARDSFEDSSTNKRWGIISVIVGGDIEEIEVDDECFDVAVEQAAVSIRVKQGRPAGVTILQG